MDRNTAQLDQVEALVLDNETGNKMAFGSVAQRMIQSGFNVNALRTNDILHKEEWLLFDRTVSEIARAQLVAVQDLMNGQGTRYPIPNAMGVTVVQHEQVTDMTDAQIDMSGIAPAERDRLNWNLVNVPLPIFHKDFRLSLRNLESGRRQGIPVDTSMAQTATRKVVDLMEKVVFNGASITSGGGTIYGYLNHPNRNTGSVAANWETTATGSQILSDVVKMIGVAQGDNMFGPYTLYVSVAVYVKMLDDLKANSDKSIIARLLEIPQLRAVRGTSQLTGSTAVLVQLTGDVVDWLDGLQPVTVMWETHGGMQINFKVMAIGAPRVKADAEGRSGIVHFS